MNIILYLLNRNGLNMTKGQIILLVYLKLNTSLSNSEIIYLHVNMLNVCTGSYRI